MTPGLTNWLYSSLQKTTHRDSPNLKSQQLLSLKCWFIIKISWITFSFLTSSVSALFFDSSEWEYWHCIYISQHLWISSNFPSSLYHLIWFTIYCLYDFFSEETETLLTGFNTSASKLLFQQRCRKKSKKFQTFIQPPKASLQHLTSLNKDFIYRFFNFTCIFKHMCKPCSP